MKNLKLAELTKEELQKIIEKDSEAAVERAV